MARISLGEKTIYLSGEEYSLVVCIEAIEKIDARWGNVVGAIEACARPPLETLVYIIRHGAGIGQREADDLKLKVLREGILNTTIQVIEYLNLCLNPTGRELGQGGDDDTSGE
jgi:hypothetical protein